MNRDPMTSLERVFTTLGHREPDRVPLFLLLSLHGAKELGLSIRDYFARPEYMVEGQIRLRKKYRNDCLYGFGYAPVEIEAWGGEVIFVDDGPPNSGEPFIRRIDQIASLKPPVITDCKPLVTRLKTMEMLKERTGDDAPLLGIVISPFSLPVMQMGFDAYLDLIYEHPVLFTRLMEVNEEFCVSWANAQFEAGATAVGYFDPVSSPTIIPRDLFLKTGLPIASRTLARIKGPVAIHMGSGKALPIIPDLMKSGTPLLGISAMEDLTELKAACRGKLALLGNLNGIEMHRWTPEMAEEKVRKAIAQAGVGGGFILSDNHGEIPWQVSDEILFAISEAVHTWGQYPLRWVKEQDE